MTKPYYYGINHVEIPVHKKHWFDAQKFGVLCIKLFCFVHPNF